MRSGAESVGKELCANVAGNLEARQHGLRCAAEITKFEIFARFFCLHHFRGNLAHHRAYGFRDVHRTVAVSTGEF